ncbi:hypothetical protein [Parasphingorhabdus sp.]|uniref:hypothetical protein n=1 Tax=Parasphingorhabdus sp. TaxID=2709688 RepID=UPI003A8E766F
MDWSEVKNWLELSTGLDRNSLHIYAGVAVQVMAALLLRRSLASTIPWFLVALVAFANEYYDHGTAPEQLQGSSAFYDDAFKDIWNTLLLPSLVLVIARFWPSLLTGRTGKSDKTRSDKLMAVKKGADKIGTAVRSG